VALHLKLIPQIVVPVDSNKSLIQITTTTISIDEITQALTKGKQLLADLGIAAGYTKVFKLKDNGGPCVRLQLYLYLYALESWDTSPKAMNYFDQPTLIHILSKIEQLFYICNVQKPC